MYLTHHNANERAKDAQGKTPIELARFMTKKGGDGAVPDIVAYLSTPPGDRDDDIYDAGAPSGMGAGTGVNEGSPAASGSALDSIGRTGYSSRSLGPR